MTCDTNFYNDNLLLHLDTGFSDSSQNNCTVAAVNATITSSAPTPEFGAGCVTLANGYISTPVTTGNGQLQHTDFTVECWFNTSVTTAGIHTIFSSGNLTGGSGFRVYIDPAASSTASITFQPISEGVGWTISYSGFSTSTGVWADGNWHALALVRTGDSMTIYVD